MSSISELIDFLVGLMRDEHAQAEFTRNPQDVLSHHGLTNVTGQDVRDARMIMQDCGGIRPSGGQSSSHKGGHNDPVREIHHTATHYQVEQHYQYVDQTTINLVSIDDRDTTVVDSFNSNDNNDTHVVAVQDNSPDTIVNVEDSFNQPPAPASVPAPVETAPDPVVEQPVSVDPVEESHEPIPVEPIDETPVHVDDHHLTEPVHEVPDLDHHPVDAAVI